MKHEDIKRVVQMAWPAIVESFFTAFAGLVDSLMVSSLGAYAVAAVGLTTQPKFLAELSQALLLMNCNLIYLILPPHIAYFASFFFLKKKTTKA